MIVLTEKELEELSWLFDVHGWDIKAGARVWGAMDIIETLETMPTLISLGFVIQNPLDQRRFYITQKGADYLREDTCICTPFDTPDELTAARAEIARLTAALEASEAARKVADAGWSECIKLNESQSVNLKIDENLIGGYREEIETLKQELRIYRDEIPF